MQRPHNQIFSLYGKGSKLKGFFQLKGPTRLSSFLEGEITMEDEEDLSIERHGDISGKVTCHNLIVYGKFTGEIMASGKVTIFPSAVVKGKINASSLIIHPGSDLEIEGHTKDR